MTRLILGPGLLTLLVMTGLALGVACWPRAERAPATPTPVRPTPTVYVFFPTPTLRDIFTVPPTPAPGGG